MLHRGLVSCFHQHILLVYGHSAEEGGSTTIFSKEQKLSPVLHLSVMMKHKIQDDTKKGIKRKIEIVSKVTKSKAPLKADLIVQHKELQEKLDAL